MGALVKSIGEQPVTGVFSLLMVWAGLALGHALVVIQHGSLPMGALDTSVSLLLGLFGFALVCHQCVPT